MDFDEIFICAPLAEVYTFRVLLFVLFLYEVLMGLCKRLSNAPHLTHNQSIKYIDLVTETHKGYFSISHSFYP